MRGLKELIGFITAVIGLCMTIGGAWLIWDWINSLVHFVDWGRAASEWFFPLPFFLETVRWDKWTMPYDLGLTLIGLGWLIGVAGSYIVGKVRA